MDVPGRARAFLEQDYDLVVIGGGTAGASAARAARAHGARVVVVTDRSSRTRVEVGAGVLAKALVASAARGRSFLESLAEARRVISTLIAARDTGSLQDAGVDVIEGRARFADPSEIVVGDERVRSGRFIIATGSHPHVPAIAGLAAVNPLTTASVLDLDTTPASLGVIGGGASGCELAQALARLGVRVTLFEARDRVLADEESEASGIVTHALRADGVDVRVDAPVTAVEAEGAPGGARILASRGESVQVERVLLATGRRAVTDGLDLAAAGIDTDIGGFIRVDEHLRTNVPGTYAVGDVTGLLPLAHAADEMGRLAAAHALSRGRHGPFRIERIPRVTLTDPEVARIGVVEAEAGYFARIAYLPLSEVDRAVLEGTTHGFIKLIAEPRVPTAELLGGRLVGATIVAPHAGEMIAEVGLAIRTGVFPARLARSVHAHPTWSAGVQRCAAQFVVEIDGRRARRARR